MQYYVLDMMINFINNQTKFLISWPKPIMTEIINQTPEIKNKESKWLRNETKIAWSALATTLLALNIQIWYWNNKNWQT